MIIIAPYAKAMRNSEQHPKNYPYWREVIEGLKGNYIVQVGVDGEEQLVPDFRKNERYDVLVSMVADCKTWISVDSFFQHLGWYYGVPGVVLFGQSDPNIFGHPENVNLLKSRKYIRKEQFWMWEQANNIPEAFVSPEEVIREVNILLHK